MQDIMNLREFETYYRAMRLKYSLLKKIQKFKNYEHVVEILTFEEFSRSPLDIKRAVEKSGITFPYCNAARRVCDTFQDLPMSTANLLYDTYIDMKNQKQKILDANNTEEKELRRKKRCEAEKALKEKIVYYLDNLCFEKVSEILKETDSHYFLIDINEVERLNRFSKNQLCIIDENDLI